jgi:glucose-6-phosphate isomerase
VKEHGDIILDFARQKLTVDTFNLLKTLAKDTGVHKKLLAMMNGDKINTTEDRSVLHTALRAPKSSKLIVDGKDVITDVHQVLDAIATFSKDVREGVKTGSTGKKLINVVSIGIG